MCIFKILPNIITAARIFFAPLIVCTLSIQKYGLSCALFLLAALTDYADGFLARRWDAVSSTGKILDPLADKIFLGAILTSLWMKGLIFSFVYWSIIIRDIILLVGAGVMFWKNIKIFPPCMSSKISTTLQSIMGLFGFLSLLYPHFFEKEKTLFIVMGYCVFCTTVWSFCSYGMQAYDLWRKIK